MSGSPRSILRWGILQLSVILTFTGFTGVWMPAAGSSGSQVQVAIVVLPPAGEQRSSTPRGDPTVSARLLADATTPSASLDLIVVDEHGADDGWTVKIVQPSVGTAPSLLNGYQERVVPQGADAAPHSNSATGDALALGQPLTRMTPLLVSAPAAEAGTYRIGFDLAPSHDPAPVTPLIISVSSAP